MKNDWRESSVCAGGHAETVTETKQRSVLFPEEETKNIAELTSYSLRLLYSIRTLQENRNCLYSLGTYIYPNQYSFLDFENWSTDLGMVNWNKQQSVLLTILSHVIQFSAEQIERLVEVKSSLDTRQCFAYTRVAAPGIRF